MFGIYSVLMQLDEIGWVGCRDSAFLGNRGRVNGEEEVKVGLGREEGGGYDREVKQMNK